MKEGTTSEPPWFTFEVPFDAYIKYAFLHTHMRAFGGLWAFANRPEELGLDAPPRALSLPEYLLDVKSREGLADLLSHVQSQPKTDEICRVDEARMPWTADDSVPANLEWDDRRSMLTDKKVPVRCTQRLVAEGTTLTVLGAFRVGDVIRKHPHVRALLTASDADKPLGDTDPFFQHLGLRLLTLRKDDDSSNVTEPTGTCAPSTVRAYSREANGSTAAWTEIRESYC